MSIDFEFSKFASDYERHNIVQEEVADELIGLVKGEPRRILDLGCGRGALAKRIDWEVDSFVGVDFAKKMLELHPKGSYIECIYGDFNNDALYEHLYTYQFDYILSASALQWAQDIEKVFTHIQRFETPYALAIFTSNTFRTLHETAGISSPLHTKESLLLHAKNILQCRHHLHRYTLSFENTHEMLRYIKRSGVSGHRSLLGYKETKALMRNYPLSYLEFEVLFLYT